MRATLSVRPSRLNSEFAFEKQNLVVPKLGFFLFYKTMVASSFRYPTRNRVRNHVRGVLKKFIARRPINTNDPITLEKVESPRFYHVTPGGVYQYTARALYDYISSSGDYKSPLTRVEFNKVEVARLQRLVKGGEVDITQMARHKASRLRAQSRTHLAEFLHGECLDLLRTAIQTLQAGQGSIRESAHAFARRFNTLALLNEDDARLCAAAARRLLDDAPSSLRQWVEHYINTV